jgi:7-carboxy-7-deazaguanine synthase
MTDNLNIPIQVTEIFQSIQGESSHAGKPCVFVRLTGCSLRCVYCDTQYAYSGGHRMTIGGVLGRVSEYPTRLIEVTGGEPLEQDAAIPLITELVGHGYTVMLETGGHVPLNRVPEAVIKIIDIKCPNSGESGTICMDNIHLAAPHDEFKFVISSRADYEWSRDFCGEHLATRPQTVLFAPVHDALPPKQLSEWILEDGLPVRLQLQVHKFIWDPVARGV